MTYARIDAVGDLSQHTICRGDNQIMYESFFELAERNDIPKDAYFRAHELARRADADDIAKARAFEAGLDKLQKSYVDQLHAMIGEKHLRRYQNLHRRRMKRVKQAQQSFRPTPEGFLEQDRLYDELMERSTKAIKASRVDVRKVPLLARRTHNKAQQLFERTVGKGIESKGDRSGTNQRYRAPFDGQGGYLATRWTDEPDEPSYDYYLNRRIGLVGSRSTIGVTGADDSDDSYVLTRMAISQWCVVLNDAPRIRVRINDMDWVANTYSGSTRDECGMAECTVRQRVRFFARLLSPFVGERHYFAYASGLPVSSGFDYAYHERRDTHRESHAWSQNHFPDTPTEFVEIGGPFGRGTMALVQVGVEAYNQFWSNDTTISQSLDQRYQINEIGISLA